MRSSLITAATAALIAISLSVTGCSGLRPQTFGELPPILTQDEVIRPYDSLARIQVTREVFGVDETLTPAIREWGYNAIRQEAAKMGADAVIFPEVTGQTTTFAVVVPSTEYRASGVAIKFK
ncbi:MAG TPA: hypothetical protein PLN25_03635 [Deltaproteobacteria bacterium]|nr:hypothetical protein [Deltaproteobacteria bacterium]HQB38530.1 hypothetical protein [Deltaproteobacteria bacterium]